MSKKNVNESFQETLSKIVSDSFMDSIKNDSILSYEKCRSRIDHEDDLFFGRIGATLTVQSIFLVIVIELFDKILHPQNLNEFILFCFVAVLFSTIGAYFSNRLHYFAKKQIGLIGILHHLIWLNKNRPLENRIIENSDLNIGQHTQSGFYERLCFLFNWIWPVLSISFATCLFFNNFSVKYYNFSAIAFLIPLIFVFKSNKHSPDKLSTIDFYAMNDSEKEESFTPLSKKLQK